jgi:anti-sigma factor RsiW
MGRTIPLPGDPHRDVQSLLPWYVTDRLDAAERARVESHLRQCPQCQADERFERRMEAQLAGLPIQLDVDWTRRSRRNAPASRRRKAGRAANRIGSRIGAAWSAAPAWTRWALASPFILLLALAMAWPSASVRPVGERAPSAGPGAAGGDIVVVFKPDAREADIRSALRAGHARLVDGPTAADGYVIHVPPMARSEALAELRRNGAVVVAEPVDPTHGP